LRSYGFTGDWPLRNELVELVQACLDRQVALHLIDETDLCRASLAGGRLALGRAAYSHVVIPPCLILHADTVARLREAAQSGVKVLQVSQSPRWQQTDRRLEPLTIDWCPVADRAETVASLPRVIELQGDGQDIRSTAWRREGRTVRLLINLNPQPRECVIDGRKVILEPGRIRTWPE
jgi:hypothetical protein